MNEVEPTTIIEQVQHQAYELASMAVTELKIDTHTQLTARDSLMLLGTLQSEVRDKVHGQELSWLRNRTLMRESLHMAALITGNPSLLQAAKLHETKRIRRDTSPLVGSIAVRYGL